MYAIIAEEKCWYTNKYVSRHVAKAHVPMIDKIISCCLRKFFVQQNKKR